MTKRKEDPVTIYLVKFVDRLDNTCYQEVQAETASDAIRQIYVLNQTSVLTILDIYVKV